jgi:hypothetical protein
MATPLSIYTKEAQYTVIRFLWTEGVLGAEVHRRLSAQYESSALPQQSMYKWIIMFKNSHRIVTDEQSGCLPISTIEENIEQVYAIILDCQ